MVPLKEYSSLSPLAPEKPGVSFPRNTNARNPAALQNLKLGLQSPIIGKDELAAKLAFELRSLLPFRIWTRDLPHGKSPTCPTNTQKSRPNHPPHNLVVQGNGPNT